ncbi:putative disease resistance RPP13-like protein 1 [Bienertia sinuspersici]
MSAQKMQIGHLTLLSNLRVLYLSCCEKCQQLPSLGKLPHLKVLKLESFDEVKSIGEEFYQSSSNDINNYVELISTVVGVPDKEVFFPKTAFPSLETLWIEECPQLETIPLFNLQSLRHLVLNKVGGRQLLHIIKGVKGLTMLRVEEMQKLRFLPQEIIKCENVESIPINGMISLKSIKVYKSASLACIPNGLISLYKLTIRD